FDVVESSAKMIALAQKRVAPSERVRFFCGDANSPSLVESLAAYDAVVTCFFLDCFTEGALRGFLERITPRLLPGAIWLVSEFEIPPVGWRRWHAQAWIWVMYRFFHLTTGLKPLDLPPIDRLLTEFGMHRADARRWWFDMIVASELV